MQSGVVIELGTIEYRKALDMQQTLCFKRGYDQMPDTLLLLEHPHVFTLGRGTDPAHLFIDRPAALALGADIIQADRGGSVTYHGPGQLIGYPILDLGLSPDLHQYLRDLEEVLIRTLKNFNIAADRFPGLTGVWVNGAKIASIGVKVTRGITKHGFSLNIDPQMNFFNYINACGFNRSHVSMRQLLGEPISANLVKSALVKSFEVVFEHPMIFNSEERLEQLNPSFPLGSA